MYPETYTSKTCKSTLPSKDTKDTKVHKILMLDYTTGSLVLIFSSE